MWPTPPNTTMESLTPNVGLAIGTINPFISTQHSRANIRFALSLDRYTRKY
jgi:hypothetical protein